MYTTRPLTLYQNAPEAISVAPEGPNSGFLVLQDEDSAPTCCFGLCQTYFKHLPLPQNKRLVVRYKHESSNATYYYSNEVYLIPVINHPLSSGRYYAIKADGKTSQGKVYTSSKEENKGTYLFCIPYIKDLEPTSFDSMDIYQQFQIYEYSSCGSEYLRAKSVAPDGHPPEFLRRDGWYINTKSLKNSTLGDAHGVDTSLRAQLPDFGFPLSQQCSKSVVVGKWYCPFMFIKEGTEIDQIKQSLFYEMTLEQRWEQIFVAEKRYTRGKFVKVDVMVSIETSKIAGREAVEEERNNGEGVVWFKIKDRSGVNERVGVSSLIMERMMWEQERVGFVREKKEKQVKHDEEHQGISDWSSYGCYVLVETFVLKRNDGNVVLTYDFRHTHQLRSKWE